MTTASEPAQDADSPMSPGGEAIASGEAETDSPELREALAAAQAKANESRDPYLRALAEMENLRKRAARDVEQAHKFALERFAQELINVKDSLEMGLQAHQSATAESLVAGMQATLQLLIKAFEKVGIQDVDPSGQPFNPELHEAMITQEAPDQAPNTVLQVVQKGYQLNGRLLRPARVVVSR